MSQNNFTINKKQIVIHDLLQYHHPEEIIGYCSNCPNYNQFWSCPPHRFNTLDFFSDFNYATIIGIKIHLDQFESNDQALEYYHTQKTELNKRLLNTEDNFPSSIVLIAGHCWHCQKCTRASQSPCLFPDKKRYSLESLGIKISDIIQEQFWDSLQWERVAVPPYLYVVQAILSKEELDLEKLNLD